ncbi:hypothetical protein [Nonomuraea sp. NPDC050643]
MSLPLSVQRALDDGLVAGQRSALLAWIAVITVTALLAFGRARRCC